jgi:ABC-type Na+ efflux pump permease subunit
VSFNGTRIRAIFRKELRDYRRNRFIVLTMCFMPLLFIALPVIQIFVVPATASASVLSNHVGLSLLYMLLIPAVVPSSLAAYAVVGEREQGTLEPVLTTPISREEFLLGKALAAFLPTVVIAYGVLAVFLACVGAFAHPSLRSAVFGSPDLLVQIGFTPLLAGWSIWVGIAISARSSDVRVAQQLSVFASFPPVIVTGLMSFKVITPSLSLALGIAVLLLIIDGLGWRVVSSMFDRERLVTGSRS